MTGEETPPRRRRKPLLSEEDHALWEHVARSVAPKRKSKPRLLEIADWPPPEGLDHLEQRLRHESRVIEKTNGASLPGTQASATAPPHHSARHKTPPLADFDRKAVRRIRSGRIEIDARLDLHGMRQDEAHHALRGFLLGSQARGLRWVLVITGKGRVLREETWRDAQLSGEERGVLKRQVPRWLADADLRQLVVSYTTAALHHGGDGALYIQLRARRNLHG